MPNSRISQVDDLNKLNQDSFELGDLPSDDDDHPIRMKIAHILK